MKWLFIISLIIYLLYNLIIILLFKFPVSLSSTHYLFLNTKKRYTNLFTITMWAISIPLLIFGLEITPVNYKFILFISISALCFVGAAPYFKNKELENNVHNISTIICALCSIIWGFLLGDIAIELISISLMVMFYLSKDSIRIYLIETVLFLTMYLQLYLFAF